MRGQRFWFAGPVILLISVTFPVEASATTSQEPAGGDFSWSTHIEGQALDNSDIDLIQMSGTSIGRIENELLETLGIAGEDEEADPERLKTTIIADVHSWPFAPPNGEVLEAGTAYLDYVVILHELPEGGWGAAVGPALSYREFIHDMDDRLTDEAWRDILVSDAGYGEPDWW